MSSFARWTIWVAALAVVGCGQTEKPGDLRLPLVEECGSTPDGARVVVVHLEQYGGVSLPARGATGLEQVVALLGERSADCSPSWQAVDGETNTGSCVEVVLHADARVPWIVVARVLSACRVLAGVHRFWFACRHRATGTMGCVEFRCRPWTGGVHATNVDDDEVLCVRLSAEGGGRLQPAGLAALAQGISPTTRWYIAADGPSSYGVDWQYALSVVVAICQSTADRVTLAGPVMGPEMAWMIQFDDPEALRVPRHEAWVRKWKSDGAGLPGIAVAGAHRVTSEAARGGAVHRAGWGAKNARVEEDAECDLVDIEFPK